MKNSTVYLSFRLLSTAAWVFAALSSAAANAIPPIHQIQSQVQASGASWVARENWLTHLPHDQLVRMMGARNVHPDPVSFHLSSGTGSEKDGEVVDWRNQNGVDYVGAPLNQGNCGSCVAFATTGAFETQRNIAAGTPILNQRLSAEALFACGGGGCDSGWDTDEASAFLIRSGEPDVACAPYTMGATGVDVSCSTACGDIDARSHKIASYSTPSTMAEIKAALRKGPLVTTLNVYEDFVTYSSGVYKHVTGDSVGGHAISIIGFDDKKSAWIIRNSWGPDWGMGGFGYVSYDDESGVGQNNQSFVVSGEGDYLMSDLQDRAFVSGSVPVNVSWLTAQNHAGVRMEVLNSTSATMQDLACESSPCSKTLSTDSLADGKYVMRATANGKSLYRYFYVSNHAGTPTLQVTPIGFSSGAKVSDRIEFKIVAKTGTAVPHRRVGLMIQGVSPSTYAKERWSENVAEDMTVGWRTQLAPNGKYQVWVRTESWVAGHAVTQDSAKIPLTVKN